MLLFWIFYSSNIPKKNCVSVSTKIFSTWAENQHIRMISEGSCDSEDYDAENSQK